MEDHHLRQMVADELDFEPSLDATAIGVSAQGGIVTLDGRVPTLVQKHIAESAARRVIGVRGLVENLKIIPASEPYSDNEIAKRALTTLDLNVLVPLGKIQVKAERGWLTLTGEVEWDYQRKAAADDLCKLRGVAGITNAVVLSPQASASDVTRRIQDALQRNAAIDAAAITVSVANGKVRLGGQVGSWSERYAVERAAWSAPGVCAVEDRVHVNIL